MRVGDMKSSTDPVGAAPQTRMSGRRGARLALALCIAYEREEPYARLVRSLGIEPKAVLAACGPFEVTNSKRLSWWIAFAASRG